MSGLSAIATGVACHALREHARYVQSFPPGTISGGIGFSINFYPFSMTILSFAIGLFASMLLFLSCFLARPNRHPLFSGVHVTAGLFLLPFLLLLLRYVRLLLG